MADQGEARSTLPEPLRGRLALEAALLRGLLRLPDPLVRALAGAPVSKDGQTLSAEAQLSLRLQRLARKPAIETLPVPAGRRALEEVAATTAGRLPVGAVRDLDAGGRRARLYTPSGPRREPLPLLVFFHGGGFFQGSIETHDAPCRLIAQRAGVVVLSVDYRLAPEHTFPAAHDDAVAAFGWAVEHAAELGADPGRIAVGGDSAGGNLAAWVAVEAARRGWPLRLQLLVYPATDAAERDTWSAELFSEGFFLTAGYMDLATTSYTPDPVDRLDPRISPLRADLPAGLAPALVMTAGFDPLRDEGEAYARKLVGAGATVRLQRFTDQIHGFLNVVGVGRRSRAAVEDIADAVHDALR